MTSDISALRSSSVTSNLPEFNTHAKEVYRPAEQKYIHEITKQADLTRLFRLFRFNILYFSYLRN